ncbi:MAG: ABC transporter substrate-binding protein [Acidobacteriota bacterium]|nr:ABC transporter substrate-binding protein [Acidobacteriota bacterium]
MASADPKRLRVAAIDFLNPAPLMWDFEHPPRSRELARRYALHRTQPARCAAELQSGEAGLGLIPIAALTPEMAIVPGCTIASLDCVRSIQLIVRRRDDGLTPAADAPSRAAGHPQADAADATPGTPGTLDPAAFDRMLAGVQSVAADSASRSSVAYAEVLFRRFLGVAPRFFAAPAADPVAMLQAADAALLIGDPALLALERRQAIEASPGVGPCVWIDLAHQWRVRTGLPWVAAVWAARPAALADAGLTPGQLTADLQHSRDAGQEHIDDLVVEWAPRIDIPAPTIRSYLTHNIHYTLSDECIAAIRLFRDYAQEAGILPALPTLRFL